MPYTMSELYVFSREYQSRRRFYWTIFWKDLYSLLCGVIIFYIFYFGQGIMGSNGQNFGVWTYGAFSTVVCVLVHHAECAMYCRNWNYPLVLWFTLSISLLPLTFLLQEQMIKSELYRSMFAELFTSSLMWVLTILTVAAVAIPLYATKVVTQVLIYPKFFTRD